MKKNDIFRCKWLVVMVIWLALLTYLSHENGENTYYTSINLAEWLQHFGFFRDMTLAELNGNLRQLAHVFLFLVLAVLTVAVVRGLEWKKWVLLFPFLWSLLDELTKPLIHGRHFAWYDVGLNMLGCLAGTVIGLMLFRNRKSS